MRDRDILEEVVKTHHCPDCCHKSRLAIRWTTTGEQVWCPRCGGTEVRRRESMTAAFKRGEPVPIEIAGKLEQKYGAQPMTEQGIVQATETAMAQRIQQARWLAQLSPQDRTSLAHLAVRYGLDPLMKELTLYEGQPYIAVGGLVRIAHRQKMFAGLEDRPMNSAERQQYNYKAPYCWIVKVYRKDWKVPAVGTGTADPANPLRGNPVEKTRPEWMARSRAIRQALKLAFPQSLPFEEVESAEEYGVDPETGEILEGAYTESAPEEALLEGEVPASESANTPTVPNQQDTIANADLRQQIEALCEKLGTSEAQRETWCQKKLSCSYEAATREGLTRLHEALAASASKKAEG